MQHKHTRKRIATVVDITVCVLLACVLFCLFGLLIEFGAMIPVYAILSGSFLYLFILFLWAAFRLHSGSLQSERRLRHTVEGELGSVLARLGQPAFLCDENGHLLWCNRMLVDLVGHRDLLIGAQIDDVCHLTVEDLEQGNRMATVGEGLYRYEGIRVNGEEQELWFVIFTDCTAYEQLRHTYEEETPVVAYIVLDNIDELLQYVQDSYRSAAAAAEDAIKRWVTAMGGIVRAYEKDKYIAFFDTAGLQACVEDRFDMLDEVRSVRVGDGMSITVSVGISSIKGTLAEKEVSAQAALDMALQRGGDQVVLRSDKGDKFYGGKTKAVQKRANVRSRVVAQELSTLMARTESVLIMAHRFPDFDAFGASIGIARFAMLCGVRPHIVTNDRDPNIAPCFEKIASVEEYDGLFISGPQAMDLIRPNTLLILVDVNNINNTEWPDLLRNVEQVVVIDHHRKTTEFEREPLITYIEPSASSASELVSEMLEQYMTSRTLLKEEAELLLAGILLDTKQFTRNTGTRTFAAALYLRGEGAVPGESNDLFRTDVNDLTKEARFHANTTIYRDRVAIAYVDEDTDASYRVLAAKAADKLLTVKGVDAAITLVSIGPRVCISARSDGRINVQLILEELGGGGHFDVAGAQVERQTIQEVIVRLREAIDKNI